MQDYVYDMNEFAIFLLSIGGFFLVTTKFRDGWTLLGCRLGLFGTTLVTFKEFSGLNIAESTAEYYIFSAVALLIVGYSFLTWEKPLKRT